VTKYDNVVLVSDLSPIRFYDGQKIDCVMLRGVQPNNPSMASKNFLPHHKDHLVFHADPRGRNYPTTIQCTGQCDQWSRTMQCRDMAHKRPLESNSKFKAVGLNPKNADAYYQRGKANKELGNLKAAENDYKQALVLAPGDKLVLAALQELGNKQAP
jgi:hypothetical protein